MRNPFNQQQTAKKRQSGSTGFSTIETLISGLIVAAVMTAVGRLGVTAMATSHNQSSRNSIEAAINDHIQLVQMQDSYLTAEAIEAESGLNVNLEDACQNPSTFLMNHLQRADIAGSTPSPDVTMEWNNSHQYLLKLTYQFEAPESRIGTEKRTIEVNPNFSSQCYSL